MAAEFRHRTRSSGAVVAQQPVTVIRERTRFRSSTSGGGLPFGQKADEEPDDGGMANAVKGFNSQQVTDPFANAYKGVTGGTISIVAPPMNLSALMRMPNENNHLRQCIDAMVTNIEGFGYRMEYKGPEGQKDSAEAKAELERCTSLLEQPNGEYPLLDLRERFRRDLETVGDGYMEVTRTQDREVSMLYHLPAGTMRLTGQDQEPVEVEQTIRRNGVYAKVKARRYFRRYVQQVGAKKVFFKEFGDPRLIDPETGEENKSLSWADSATEVIRLSLYAPGQIYGLPRWINQIKAIMGSNEAEATNLNFFRDNAIPACVVLVSGGALTGDAVDNIQALINGKMGRDAANRIIVLEATGDPQSASPEGQIPAPRIEIRPLQAERQSDALFQEYDKNNQKKIRGSFRLPPLFVGYSDDLTYASAQTAMILAEGQVFGPERKKVDEIFNLHILPKDGQPLKYWEFRSNPPRIVGGDALFEALERLDKMGAMTPNVAIGLANEMFDTNIELIEEDWGDFPYQMVQELAKQGRLMGIKGVIDNGNPVRAQLVKGVQKDGVVPDDPPGPIPDEVAGNVPPGTINDPNPQPEKDPANDTKPAKVAA